MTRRNRSSSSSSSSTKKFDVFEFNEDDENIEVYQRMICNKFSNPSKPRYSRISKYEFLQAFAQGSNPLSKPVTSDDPIDLDAEQEEAAKCSPEQVSNKPLEVCDDDDGGGIDDQGKHANACSMDMPLQHYTTEFVECDFDFKSQSLDTLSDDDDSSQTSSSSTSSLNPSQVEVNFEDPLVEDGSAAFKINDKEKVVDVFPDFVQYEDLYSTRSRLIFSRSSLKLEGSTINGTGGTFKIEWETEDIIKIGSCWFEQIETALINILLKSKDSREAGITNENPGFKLLKFAVYDSHWSKAEEAIKLLDMRYTDTWSTIFDVDTDNNRTISASGRDSFFTQRHYFPIFDEAFEEVIFPKGEPDAVSISKRDVELLQPETFINDTIIDFYIKYLKNKLPIDEQERFHFFNSFFFRKLADLDKDPSSACDGRAAFQRVRKWTRKVNLFEKDYILIPINYSLHWSLIVICHPGEVTRFRDEEIKESSKVPCVLHMDSLRGSHKGLKNVFQSYLCEEWKERHANVVDDFSSKFLQLRFISLELPQQENLYDCGLFLLHYVECFLKEAPINFNPFKISEFSNFLNSNWFPPPEASLKRSHIQNLIYDIFENNSLQEPPADCRDKGPLSEVPGIIKHKVEADSPGDCCYPAMWHENPGIVFKHLQAAVVTSHSDCLQMSACHHRGFMSPIEETEEFREETAISIERENSHVGILASDFPSTSYISKDHRASEATQLEFSINFVEAVAGHSEEFREETAISIERENSHVGILASDFPSTSYISKDHRASEATQLEFSINFVEAVAGHSDSRTSTTVSRNTLDTGALEDQPLEKIEESHIPDKTALEDLEDSVVQDSQEIFDLTQNINLEDDTSVSKKEPLASESNERDAKRPKLMNAAGGPSRRFTRSMLKEACLMS